LKNDREEQVLFMVDKTTGGNIIAHGEDKNRSAVPLYVRGSELSLLNMWKSLYYGHFGVVWLDLVK